MKCPQESAPVVLRGARRVNKGNRISCLIGPFSPHPPQHLQGFLKAKNDSLIAENLHTDKKEEEEEGEGEELEKEEVALGREKMSRIQSMFSGEKKPMDEDGVLSSPSCTDFNELMDEGLSLGFQEDTSTPLSQVLCQRICTVSQVAT